MQLTKGAIGNLINRYKAVLKKCHLLNVFGSLAVAGMLVMGGAGMAVAADDVALENGTSETKYNPTEGADHLMGGWKVTGAEAAAPDYTGDITLTVNGGTISEIIGGSYAKGLTAGENSSLLTVKHGDITTTISGDKTTSAEFVVGGSKVAGGAGANLETGNISLIINDGTFGKSDNTNAYELVMGGNYLKASTGDVNVNNTAAAENITVNIRGGKFDTSVTGGSVAHVYGSGDKKQVLSVTDASTSVTITGGTFGQSSSTGLGAIELDPSIIGGGLALVTAQQGTATSTITGNTLVTIAQAEGKELIINDKVLGGSLAQGKGATVTIGTEGGKSTSAVIVDNVSKVGDLVGGNMAQGGMAILHGDSFVEVKAGQVEGDIMGGSYVRGAGTVTTNGNTSVVFSAANFATMPQAEYIVGGDKVLGNDTAKGEIKGTSSVTINNDASVTTGAVVGGSFSRATPGTATATVANSVVTINGGKSIAGVVGGGLAEHLSGNGSTTSTVTGTSAVYVNGGNLTNIVYTTETGQKASSYAAVAGAGLATGKNATASVGNSVVVIDGDDTVIKGNQPDTGKTGYKDNAKVVAGGVAINGGSVNVTNTSLAMNNGTVTGDLVGGNLIDGTGNAGDITSTSVALRGGTLDGEVMGGSYVRGSNTSNIDTTNVLVSGGTLKSVDHKAQYVLGGGKALVYADGQEASLTIDTTNVTISDSVKVLGGGVIGGSLAKGTGTGEATVSVTNANTTILGGTQIAGVVGGGVAENYNTATGEVSSSVTESQLTISGGTIDALRYGAQISDDGETASKAAVVGGGVASAKGTDGEVTSSVTTANTVINGGKIDGHVVAGGLADGGTATVGTANLTIKGGEINGSVYAGGAALGGGEATVEKFDVRITGGTIDGDVVAGNYTGEPATEASLMALSAPRNSDSSGSISFSGGTVTGNVVVQDGVIANVIIDGTGATVTGSYQGNANSTLTFQNYNTDFNKVATGFGTLEAAAGSNVTLAKLSTGAQTEDETGFFGGGSVPEITVTGEGTVTATNVNVDDNKTLTVADGGTLVAESLTTATGSTAKTDGLGSTLIIRNDALEDIAAGSLSSTAGSEIQFTGLGDSVAATAISAKLDSATNTGIVNVGDTKVDGLSELVENGKVEYGDWKSGTAGITTNAMKEATLTGVSDDVTQTGSFGSAQLAEGKDRLNIGTSGKENTNSLTLTGLDASENFVSASDGQVAGATINRNATLTLGDNAYTGDKAIGTILIGNGSATLNVLGAGSDVATVNSGAITASGTTTTINAKNVTLNVAGHIGGDGTTNNQSINTLTADAANVIANGGDVYANTVTLTNGLLQAAATTDETPAGGNITIAEALSGQGAVVADKTLTLTNGYTGKEGDDLTLQAETLKTAAINSTIGDLTIAATNLVTTGTTTLVDDTLVAEKVALGDALMASGASLVQVGGFYTSDDFTTEGLNKAVSVTGQSLMAYGADLAQAQQAVAETGHTGAAYYAGKELKLVDGGSLTVGNATAPTASGVAFGSDSLLVVDGTAMNGKTVFTGTVSDGPEAAPDLTASVDAGSKLHVDNAVAGGFTVFGEGFNELASGWADENVTTDSAMLDASYSDNKVTVKTNNAHTVFPNLSDGMADAVNDLYNGKLNNVDSTDMGVRFLSRATNDHFLGADKDAAAATIESAARIAFAGAVPQMTKMASDAGTNAVVNRLGFANPADGAQAMDVDGKIVDRNTTGFALWIAPLWQSQHGWGMEADNLDYGFNGNLGGVSLGADYTFENAIRAGITFNIGGGYAESSGGDLNSTENRMSFWGLGAYAGWNYENFGLMADVSYTSTWNDLKQDMDSRMGMGDLEADVQASAISAGLRAEYKLETSVLDVIPHIGVRYMSLNTWGFDAESNGGTVLEGDGFHQDIWTFPVGVTFTKDFTLDSGWSFKPSIDFSVIPAAGDIKAKQDVAFTGLPGSYEVETQMMDYLTWQGGVGLEMGNDTMSFGVNYTLQAGQHTTGHGVFGSFRYEF